MVTIKKTKLLPQLDIGTRCRINESNERRENIHRCESLFTVETELHDGTSHPLARRASIH